MRKRMPPLAYFVPFYGTYRLINRIRKLERSLQDHRAFTTEMKADLDHMRHNSYKEVQFYEARIETIYQRIMQMISLDPHDAAIHVMKFEPSKRNESNSRRNFRNLIDRYRLKF